MEEIESVRRSFWLLRTEMIISTLLLSLPIMNLFWLKYAGMNQFQIGVSQAVFTVIVILLDVPMGWLADRFSRKWANAVGDFVTAAGFIAYAFVGGLGGVIICEVILAIGMASSIGADGPLLESYCVRLGKDYAHENARIQQWAPIVMAIGMVVGGMIGAKSPRLAMLLSAVPMLVGATLTSLIVDDVPKARHEPKHPIHEIKSVIRYCMRDHKQLASTIWANAVINKSTHGIVWLTTPMLLLAHVPLWLVGVGWALNNLGAWAGATLARRYGTTGTTAEVFGWPLLALVAASLLFGLVPNPVTAMAVIVFGIVRGWHIAVMPVRVQELAPEALKTTVNSVSSTVSRLLYVVVVIVLSGVSTQHPGRGFVLNAIIFASLGLAVLPRLRRTHDQKGPVYAQK